MIKSFFATASAIAQAIAHKAMGPSEPPAVRLKPGDPAPDFALTASDGRTYRLSDFADRSAVVVAWFPKAFTGG